MKIKWFHNYEAPGAVTDSDNWQLLSLEKFQFYWGQKGRGAITRKLEDAFRASSGSDQVTGLGLRLRRVRHAFQWLHLGVLG